ncbi:protein atonal homolog 7-like [Lytechinus variegatus]|uniref:protein atonal homolog 7-like n=1 Tax=Lytechinus variegatus TaxID=7654 RepID=UPI001BB2AC5A|nr:protein atonal homolog 7-like [Lytechinus variegatus]
MTMQDMAPTTNERSTYCIQTSSSSSPSSSSSSTSILHPLVNDVLSSRVYLDTIERRAPVVEARRKRRRLAANARERKRMNGLNAAFNALRCKVTNYNGDSLLSKHDTLLMAVNYITALRSMLEDAGSESSESRCGSPD